MLANKVVCVGRFQQETQLSQRDRTMLGVTEYFAK